MTGNAVSYKAPHDLQSTHDSPAEVTSRIGRACREERNESRKGVRDRLLTAVKARSDVSLGKEGYTSARVLQNGKQWPLLT
jgi:hypothetical protein